jgi:hypothetical protein
MPFKALSLNSSAAKKKKKKVSSVLPQQRKKFQKSFGSMVVTGALLTSPAVLQNYSPSVYQPGEWRLLQQRGWKSHALDLKAQVRANQDSASPPAHLWLRLAL